MQIGKHKRKKKEIRTVNASCSKCSKASEEANDFMKELINVASSRHVNTRTQATADWDFHRTLNLGLNTGTKEGCWRRRHDSASGPGAGQSCCVGD